MLNTVSDLYFKHNPSKIIGEMSIEKYMNKIIVKNTIDDVKRYFSRKLAIKYEFDNGNSSIKEEYTEESEDIYELLSDIEDPIEAIEMLEMLDSSDEIVNEAKQYLKQLI